MLRDVVERHGVSQRHRTALAGAAAARQRGRALQRGEVLRGAQVPGHEHLQGHGAPAPRASRGLLPRAHGVDGGRLRAAAHGEPAQGLPGGRGADPASSTAPGAPTSATRSRPPCSWSWSGGGCEVTYVRTPEGHEVDFLARGRDGRGGADPGLRRRDASRRRPSGSCARWRRRARLYPKATRRLLTLTRDALPREVPARRRRAAGVRVDVDGPGPDAAARKKGKVEDGRRPWIRRSRADSPRALATGAPGPEELRRAREVLEAVVADRALLAQLPDEERTRLLVAAGRTVHPETAAEAAPGAGRCARRRSGGSRRATAPCSPATGIRAAREAEVFVPPPRRLETRRAPRAFARGREAADLLRLQGRVPPRALLLRRAVPRLRRAQLREALPDRRPRRPRGARHRGAGQDRLPGRAQAAAGRGDRGGHDPLPARRRAPLREPSPTSATGASACRSTASTCATRRASRSSAASSTASSRGWT